LQVRSASAADDLILLLPAQLSSHETDSMTRRYFSTDLPSGGGLVALSGDEAAHACRVMRVQVGDLITLFDGQGHEAEAEVQSLGRNQCVCVAGASTLNSRMPQVRRELGIAMPKPDRAKEMIERLTELGVASVTPIIADRTQRPPSASLIAKLIRAVVEACKQCERNLLMPIHDPVSSKEFFARDFRPRRVIAHQGPDCLTRRDLAEESSVVAAIGPEGGWTDDEVALAEANGFERLSLGPRIYRIETAAVVLGTEY
jgi:16S rRNA (uracil1498-N3)-methyltransferase